jgi:hypothetical protein
MYAALLGGCLGAAERGATDPLVITESSPAVASNLPQEREAVVAEIRAKAEAGQAMPFPEVGISAETERLAARPEPRSAAEVEAIEAELALIARRRALSPDPAEIAALEARARTLRAMIPGQPGAPQQ